MMPDLQDDDHILDLEPPKHRFGFIFTLSLVIIFILLLFFSLSNFNIGTFSANWSCKSSAESGPIGC